MKNLKFRINQTKKQRETLTPSKVLILDIICENKDVFGNLVFVVKNKNNFYQLKQWNINEFCLKKIINIKLVDFKTDNIDVMNMTNTTKNGRVMNYFSIIKT